MGRGVVFGDPGYGFGQDSARQRRVMGRVRVDGSAWSPAIPRAHGDRAVPALCAQRPGQRLLAGSGRASPGPTIGRSAERRVREALDHLGRGGMRAERPDAGSSRFGSGPVAVSDSGSWSRTAPPASPAEPISFPGDHTWPRLLRTMDPARQAALGPAGNAPATLPVDLLARARWATLTASRTHQGTHVPDTDGLPQCRLRGS